jgi:hypothetical protein
MLPHSCFVSKRITIQIIESCISWAKLLKTYFTILVSDCFAEVVVLAEMAGNVVLSEALKIVQPLRQPAGARYVHISKIIRFANIQNKKGPGRTEHIKRHRSVDYSLYPFTNCYRFLVISNIVDLDPVKIVQILTNKDLNTV